LRFEYVPLGPLVKDVLEMHEPLALDLDVRLTMSDESHVRTYVDVQRFSEVLINLVSNAVKYNLRSGRVEVWLGVQAVPDSVERLIRIDVRDTGIGMSELQVTHLFEPFNRLGVEAGSVPGSGLGLCIAQSMVTAMGGRLEVKSTLGEGSVFSLLLPAGQTDTTRTPPPA
jgi:signal transduction histidine kinase